MAGVISQACHSGAVGQLDRVMAMLAPHNAPLVTPTGANPPIV